MYVYIHSNNTNTIYIQTDLNIIQTNKGCGRNGQVQVLKAIRNTNDFLYAVGQIAYKQLKTNRAGVDQIDKFILDILVLAREKNKTEKKREKTSQQRTKEKTGQLGLDGVIYVEDYMTVINVVLLGPVARRKNNHGIVSNMVFDRTSFAHFIIQPPTMDSDEIPEQITFHFIREMCMKNAIGKSGYYSNNIFVVGVYSKLYIQVHGGTNNMEECGPSTSDMWLAFNRRRSSKKHMNIKIYLGLGYKLKRTEDANEGNYKPDVKNLEEPLL